MADPAFLSNSVLGIQVETTRNTAPATGVYNAIPILDGISFGIENEIVTSDVYDGTRQNTLTLGGSQLVRARFNTRLNYEQGQKDLMRFAIHSTDWTAGVITSNANASYFFTLVAKMELGATDDYHVMTGCEIASATINMPLNDQSTISYEVIGYLNTIGNAMPGTATLGTLVGKDPFRTMLTGATPTWGGTNLVGATDATVTISNQVTPKFSWGGGGVDHAVNGNQRTNGSTTIYYRGDDLAADAVAGTIRALTFVLKCNETASEDTMTFNFPSARIVNAPVSDSTGSMVQAIDFAAQRNAGISAIMNVTVA